MYGTKELILTVNPLPTLIASNPAVCQGVSATINVTPQGNTKIDKYYFND